MSLPVKSFVLSVIAAVALSSSAQGQTESSGTLPSSEPPFVSTSAAAPSVSTATVVAVESSTASAVSVSSQALPGLATGYIVAPATATAATDAGVVPRPWVIGEIKADGQFNVVWKTPGPVKAKPWSPYIEGNDKKPDEPAKK